VTIDDRTNTLLVQDTVDRLEDIRRLVRQLDVPVRQVLIESRIVIANSDFSRELGTRFGVSHVRRHGAERHHRHLAAA
jgi:type IV pilus assembly protein PilQ